MRPNDFETLRDLLKKRSGLDLGPDKAYLLESRLQPVARRRGLKDVAGVAEALRGRPDETLAYEVVEAMTTNESSFFRDQRPFEQMRETILPRLAQKQGRLRIWSAACSSGQEAYSLAMLLKAEGAKYRGTDFEIVGTDISREMVERARAGTYTQFEVQRGLPARLLVEHFTQAGDRWQLSPSIRAMASFREWNLLSDLAPLGRFDVVFCRNVLIYFDPATKARVLERIAERMNPEGILFLGSAETVIGITDRFQAAPGGHGMYVPVR